MCFDLLLDSLLRKGGKVDFSFFASASLMQKGQAVEGDKMPGRDCEVLEGFGRENTLDMSR